MPCEGKWFNTLAKNETADNNLKWHCPITYIKYQVTK